MLKNGNSVTLVDVARAAGVSLKTASRVLNDSDELRPETEKLVREAMASLGYQPNELARGLKLKKSAAIGLIVPNLSDPFNATAISSIQNVARAHGYVVILASSGGDAALEKTELQAMTRRQIDGIILSAASCNNSDLSIPLSSQVPVVVFDEPVRGAEVDTITVTNRKAAREATAHLLGHGYRRILAVGARPSLYTCAERVTGYRAAMKQRRARPVELLVPHEQHLTAAALAPFFGGPHAIDAIFSLNWVCTIGILRGLRELGKSIPEDVALIAFDDFDLAEVVPPGVTVVRQPVSELGTRAARSLFERIEKKSALAPRKIVLSTELIFRGSCGCRPKA